MVAIFTGAGTGFERGSGSTLGASGLLGSSSFGRSGQQLFLNAANGNLMISRQDEFLVGRGPDVGISRTYNSLGNQSDDNGDNWRQSTERVLFDIVGAVGSWGSTLKRRSGDGSEIAYAWNGSAYVATDGAGAYDTITYAGGYYTWTDGDSRVTETYGQVGTDWRILSQSDTSGNTLTFQYTNGKLYRVTTADGGYTQYDWSGNNISQIVTGFSASAADADLANAIYSLYDAAFGRAPDRTGFYFYLNKLRSGFTLSALAADQYNSAEYQARGVAAMTNEQYVDFLYQSVQRRAADSTGRAYYVGLLAGGASRSDVLLNFAMSAEHLQITSSLPDRHFSGTLELTRTRYTYDASNRLSTVTVDETPEDNSLADGNNYTTTYTYFGTTDLVATISETDGSAIAIAYDGYNRVSSFTQTIASGVTRTTILGYGTNYTTVTDPLGQTTRLDYAPGNSAVDPSLLSRTNVTVSASSINGQAATQFAVQTPASTASAIQYDGSAQAGDYVTYGITVQAGTAGASMGLGFYGGASAWGDIANSSARIVSGSGTLVQTVGGLWTITGLSTTIPTRVEVTRLFIQAESFAVCNYPGYPGYPAGTAVSLANPTIIKSADAANLAQRDLANWGPFGGATLTSVGTIDGATGYQITDPAGGWAGVNSGLVARAGDQFSFSVSLKAVGSYTSQSIGLYGNTSGWGAAGASFARIVSGPGTLTQTGGGLFTISGLSTTQVTRVEIVRTYDQNEGGAAYIYTDLPGGYRAGSSLIASAPLLARRSIEPRQANQLLKITAPAAYSGGPQQVVQFGYDDKGDLTSVTDASGNSSTFTFDANGNTLTATDRLGNVVTRTYNSDNQVVTETRTGSDKDSAAASHTTRYIYDSAKRLRFIVSAEGDVTEYAYFTTGEVAYVQTYPGQAYDLTGLATAATPTEAQLVSWRSALSSANIVENLYDARGNLRQQITYGGPTAAAGYSQKNFVYDQAGQLLSSVASGTNTEYYVYDGLGRVTTRTDVNGGTTSFVFNDAATQTIVTLANGFVQTSTYNKVGELVSFTESSANLTNGGTATYKYDADGRVRVMIDASGVETYYLYDKAGRRVAEATGAGTLIEYRYDANDRIVATVRYGTGLNATQLAALQNPNSTAEISAIRPPSYSDDLWTWSIYDKEGHVLEAIEGDGAVTAYDYDASGRLIATRGFVNKLSAAQISGFKTTAPASVVLPTAHANDTVSRIFFDKDGRTIGVLDATGYLTRTIYDAAGRKVQEIAYANATTAGIRATGTFQALINSVGSSTNDRGTRYIYDGQGLLRFTIDALNHVTAYSYGEGSGAHGALRQTTQYAGTIGALGSYTYDTVQSAVAALASDPANRASYLVYDSAGRVAYSIDATGAVLGYSYDALGQVTKKIAYATTRATTSLPTKATMDGWASANPFPADRVTRFYYDGRGALRFTIDAEGYVTRIDYDAEGREIATVRWDAAVAATDVWTIATVNGAASGTYAATTKSYDAAGRLAVAADAEGGSHHYLYHANGVLAWDYQMEGTALESRTYLEYDLAGRLTLRTEAFGTAEAASTWFAYNGLGDLASTTDPNNRTTSYTYDKLGRVLSETNAASGVTSYEYDAFGEVVRTTDARGNSSYRYYDKLGRATLVRDAENYVTETSFTAFGEIGSVKRWFTAATNTAAVGTLPTGHAGGSSATTSFVYDKLGRVTTTIDAEGGIEGTWYNAFGNATRTQNKLGGLTDRGYNRRGQLTYEMVVAPVYNSAGNQVAPAYYSGVYEYDARGNLIHQIEAQGLAEQRDTWFSYDKANRLLSKTGAQVPVGPTGTLTTPGEYYAYDKRGNLIESWDNSGAHSWYYYDDLDRKTAQIVAVTATQGSYSAFAYDANGNLVSSKAYGGWASLPSVAGGAAPAVPAGGYRETVYTYDNINRVLTQSVAGQVIGSWNGSAYVTSTGALTTTYEYDAMGNVVKTTAPDGGTVFSYYDKLGRKTAQVDQERYLTAWTLDAEGNVLNERRYATQAGTPITSAPPSVATNAADRVTDFTYDKMGNRLTETRHGVEAWTVDPNNGVLHPNDGVFNPLASTDSIIVYTYNALGQVLTKREATQSAIRQPNNSFAWAYDQTTYEYDLGGRLLVERRAPFNEDPASTTVVTPTVRYYYDGLGDLVRTVQGGATLNPGTDRVTINLYGAGGRLLGTTDATGNGRSFLYDVAGRKTGEYYTRDTGTGGLKVEGISYQYDRAGNLTRQGVNTISGTSWTEVSYTQSAYDAYGEVTDRGTNGWQEQFAYDGAGRLTKSNAGDGVWRFYVYDAAGNQTMVVESEGADISGYTQASAISNATADGLNATVTVYDKRGQATSTIQRQREFGTGARQDITLDRGYNAFGETLWEEDAYDRRTDYSYNTMGRTTKVERPTVSVTFENGTQSNVRPTEKYFYDLSGRLVGTQDANSALAESLGGTGYKTTQLLLAGTGYGDGTALVINEWHPDGGAVTNKYDVFGDLRTTTDEIGRTTSMAYDGMGRLTQVTKPGGLTDYYVYDVLGQRTAHWNSVVGSTAAEKTEYDQLGRITRQVAYGGDVTITSYAWSGTLTTPGMGASYGGWVITTGYANGRTASQSDDLYGRTVSKTDLGGHTTSLTYDLAGRMTAKTIGAETSSYAWLSNGLIGTITTTISGVSTVQTSTYDKAGNKLTEYQTKAGTVIENATATYDALNRLLTWSEAGNSTTHAADSTYKYDANSNVMSVTGANRYLNADGTVSIYQAAHGNTYRYDVMNRLVQNGSGTATYDAAGQRITMTTYSSALVWTGYRATEPGSGVTVYADDPSEYDWQGYHWVASGRATFSGMVVETYSYTADGLLDKVWIASEIGQANGSSFINGSGVMGSSVKRADFDYDSQDRVSSQIEYEANGTTIAYNRYGIVYDGAGRVTNETNAGKQGLDTYQNFITNTYGTGSGYALGAVVTVAVDTWRNGSDSAAPDTLTTNGYSWYDGAVQSSIAYKPDTGNSTTYNTSYTLSPSGVVSSISINDGRPRTVTLTNDAIGQALRRDEADNVTAQGDPHEIWYRFNGREMGHISNDGTYYTDYATSIADREKASSGTGAFKYGQTYGAAVAVFDAPYEAFNSYSQGSSTGSYEAQGGETLESIAANLWGDSALWYKLAEANGLSAGTALSAGQRITVPQGVVRSSNRADTFKPYDPAETLGSTSPTTPKAQKKNCGVLGQIIIAAIAVAVTIWATPAGAGILQTALGAMAGSTISQYAGVVTGIQDDISFKGIALAGITAGLTQGLGKVPGLDGAKGFVGTLQDAARGMLANAATQGIAIATGMQKKFDFTGVAAAGVVAGVSSAVGGRLGITATDRGSFGDRIATATASALAGAATRSVIDGTDFGDNVIAVLPDVIAQTIGAGLEDAIGSNGGTDREIKAAMRETKTESVLMGVFAGLGGGVLGGQDRSTDGAQPTTVPVLNTTTGQMTETGAGIGSVPKTGPFTIWNDSTYSTMRDGTESERLQLLAADVDRYPSILSFLSDLGSGAIGVVDTAVDYWGGQIDALVGPDSLYGAHIGQPFAQAVAPVTDFVSGALTDPQVGYQMMAGNGGNPTIGLGGATSFVIAEGYQGAATALKFLSRLGATETAPFKTFYRGDSFARSEFLSNMAESRGLAATTSRLDAASTGELSDIYSMHGVSSSGSPVIGVTDDIRVAEFFARGPGQDQLGHVTTFKVPLAEADRLAIPNYENPMAFFEPNPQIGLPEREFLFHGEIDSRYIFSQQQVKPR